jgi:hypothetical protein
MLFYKYLHFNIVNNMQNMSYLFKESTKAPISLANTSS